MVPDRRADRNPDATRAALLEAAGEQFAARGYEGSRTQRIADAAGANKAMISYHFGGKMGLYRAVVTDRMAELRPRLVAIRERPGSAADKWSRYLGELLAMLAREPVLWRIILREHLDGGTRLQSEFASDISEFFRTTRSILDQGRREGTLAGVDPHAVHLSLIGAVFFYLASIPFREKAESEGRLTFPAPDTRAYLSHLKHLFTGLFTARTHPQETGR